MTDRMVQVQVPVALIERLRAYADEQRARARFIADENRGEWWAGVATARREVANDLDALLSQPTPTPTAEPEDAAQVWADGFEAGATWPQHTPSGVPVDPPLNPYEVDHASPAAPPRIEDMASGTTFTAAAMRGVEHWTRQVDGVTDTYGNVWSVQEIDPSTIRDVHMPKEHP